MAEFGYFFAGVVLEIVPEPNLLVVVVEPSERRVIEPEPKGVVFPVTVLPLLSVVLEIVPEPNLLVVVVEPSERRVIEPEPKGVVFPVTVLPLLSGGAAKRDDPKIRRQAATMKKCITIGKFIV